MKVIDIGSYVSDDKDVEEARSIVEDFVLLYGHKIVKEIKHEYILGGMIEAIDFCVEISLGPGNQKRAKAHIYGEKGLNVENREHQIVPMFIGGRKIWVTVIGMEKT